MRAPSAPLKHGVNGGPSPEESRSEMQPHSLSVHYEVDPDATARVSLRGALDAPAVPALLAQMQTLLSMSVSRIQLDLAAVNRIDLAGVGAVLRLHRRAVSRGC